MAERLTKVDLLAIVLGPLADNGSLLEELGHLSFSLSRGALLHHLLSKL